MRKTSQPGIELIKEFEGFSSEPYQDVAGIWTNGYGHTKGVTKDTPPVSEDEAIENLKSDLLEAEEAVERLVIVPLNDNQFDALVSFTLNLGQGSLERSTLLKKLNGGYYHDAALEFGKWIYAGGKVVIGLIRRREKEKELFLA